MGDVPWSSRNTLDRRTVLRWGVRAALASPIAAAAALGLGAEDAVAADVRARSAFPRDGSRQLAADVVFRGPATRPVLALTIDDGPSARWTPLALALLDRHGIPATFFLVGARAERW